jgi:hypothetical protein
MDIQDRLEQSKSYQSFRTGLDLGMGALYVVIGGFIAYAKYFGTVALPDTYAYLLAGLMLVYGVFRIYRGLVVVLRKKEDPRSLRQ